MKMWSIYIMEYYIAIRNDPILQFAATLMKLEVIILNEKARRTNTQLYIISSYHILCGI